MKKAIAAIISAAVLSGCATGPTGANYRPLVDSRGAAAANYERDLFECQSFARQRAGAAESAMGGAIAGALLGVALGAIVGGGIRNEMAGIGALTGGLQAAGQGEGTQRDIIRRCLAGRNHTVLD